MGSFRAISFNIRGLRGNLEELNHVLQEEKIDIALVVETLLKPYHRIRTPGFRIHREDRVTKGGGVAILVREDISHERINVPTTECELVAIRLTFKGRPITFIALYNPPKTDLDIPVLEYLLNNNERTIVAGDFNCRHSQWGCLRRNKNGKKLYDFVTSKRRYTLSSTMSPTFYPDSGKTPSTIDLIISNCGHLIGNVHTLNCSISDHLPVSFKVMERPDLAPRQSRLQFNLANWNYFKSHLNEVVTTAKPKLGSAEDIEEAVTELTFKINTAISQSVPTRTVRTRPPTLPEDIQDLIRVKNWHRRRWQRYRCPLEKRIYNNLQREVKERIDSWRTETWDTKLEKIAVNDGSLWNLVRALKKGQGSTTPLITEDGRRIFNADGKAALLQDHFSRVHEEADGRGNRSHNQMVTARVSKFLKGKEQCPTTSPIEPLIPATPKEIAKIIHNLKTRKAPGLDGINNIVLKRLPRKVIVLLTNTINAILRLNYFPSAWKTALVVAIPKPNKNPSLPSSYRPISLLSSLSKVTERIISSRLKLEIARTDIIPLTQFGFTAQHSTIHQLLRVLTDITDDMTLGKESALLLLDSEKAFDSVWTHGLTYIMRQANMSIPICKLIHSFLTDRRIRVRVESYTACPTTILSGVPQGSVLSPTLFNIYTSQVISNLPRGVKLAAFADDLALYSSGTSNKRTLNRLQNGTHLLTNRLEKWKIKINTGKTEAIFFSNRRVTPKTIKIRTKEVQFKDCIKYLGVHIDRKLLWAQHIDKINKAAKIKMGRFYNLLKSTTLSSKAKLLLYKSLIRPTMTYASPVWKTVAKTHFQKLEVTQNKCLRLALNKCRRTPIHQLLQEAGVLSLQSFIHSMSSCFHTKLPLHPNPLVNRLGPLRRPKRRNRSSQ